MKKIFSIISCLSLIFFVFGTHPILAATQKIEAENAIKITSRPQNYNDPAASGGVAVEDIDENGAGLEFSNINIATGLKLVFNSMQSGKIGLYVNNVRVKDLNFTGNGVWFGAYATQDYSVNIPSNATVKIQFDNGDSAMNIDFVEFSTASTTPTPTPTSKLTPTPIPFVSKININRNNFNVRGAITDISGNTFTIGGQVVNIDPSISKNFHQRGNLQIGANVQVEGMIQNGNFFARNITVIGHERESDLNLSTQTFDITGVVSSIDNNTITINDQIITIDPSKVSSFQETGNLQVGSTVRATGIVQNGTMFARQIIVTGQNQSQQFFSIQNLKNGDIQFTLRSIGSKSFVIQFLQQVTTFLQSLP